MKEKLISLMPNTEHLKTIIYTAVSTTVMTSITTYAITTFNERSKAVLGQVANAAKTNSEQEGNLQNKETKFGDKKGLELEKVFLEEMIKNDLEAIQMSEKLKNGSTNPTLLKFANEVIRVKGREIEQQRYWLKSY